MYERIVLDLAAGGRIQILRTPFILLRAAQSRSAASLKYGSRYSKAGFCTSLIGATVTV